MMWTIIRSWGARAGATAMLLALAVPGAAAERERPDSEDWEETIAERAEGRGGVIDYLQGTVHRVNTAGPTVVIDGQRYGFAIDSDVSIGGTFGAPTLLQPGMEVEIVFADDGAGMPTIHGLRELPAGTAATSQ